ncbi:MAG: adenylate cyclase, partial [Myxococcota bacterium]
MPANLELKARCADLDATRARAQGIATAWLGPDEQVDTYFRTASGRLKLRESSLSGAQLIPYLRPDQVAARRSDYVVIPVPEPARTKQLLAE